MLFVIISSTILFICGIILFITDTGQMLPIGARLIPFIKPDTAAVFGIFSGDTLWASLVLGFDADKQITLITTADSTELKGNGGWKAAGIELVEWVARKHKPCSLGLFTDLDKAKAYLASKDKLAVLRHIAKKGKLLADPLPKPLEKLLGTI